VYQALSPDVALSQGDVLDGCPLFGLSPQGQPVDLNAAPARWEARVIVLTQACDLAQAKTTKVLVAWAHSAQALVDQGALKAQAVRDQVRRGLVYGWYFLPAAPPPVPLPETIVDLRDLHTVSRAVLERLVADGKRLCRLVTPYREHLAQHLAVTYSRIGLPEPYDTQG
jgi:hypothetical protein